MQLHTLHIEHSVLLAVFTLLTAVNARLQRHLPGVQGFAFYNLLALLGSLSVTLRAEMPQALFVTVGSICEFAAYVALFQCMSQMFGFRRRLLLLLGAWFLLGCAMVVWCGGIRPDTAERLLAHSIFLAGEQVFVAAVLLSGKREVRGLSWMPSAILLALAAFNLIRLGMVAVRGVPINYLQSGSTLAGIVVLSHTCLQCGLMLAFVWMTAALLRRDLEIRASTDPLTGLLNRRALDTAALQAVDAIGAGKGVFAVVLLDLDMYKPLNDRFGHAAGDLALQAVSRCLQRELRTTDLIARPGGDEFVLLLRRTPGKEAVCIADRLRDCLEALDLGLGDPTARITGSFGVAQAVPGEGWEQLLERCDCALYAAKRSGGNAVYSHGVEDPRKIEDRRIEEPRTTETSVAAELR